MLQLAPGDVPAVVNIFKLDFLDLLVDPVPRLLESVLTADDSYNPAAVGDEMFAVAAGAGVKHECIRLQLVQTIDQVPRFISLWVTAGRQHNTDRVAAPAQRAGTGVQFSGRGRRITGRTDRLRPWEARPAIPDLRIGS